MPSRIQTSHTSLPILVPAGAPSWVTVELLNETLRVWQPYYDTPLRVDDALEILLQSAALCRLITNRTSPR